MAKRFDIVTPRKGRDGKTFWTKIGVAFENKTGGYNLSFEALPIASMTDDGSIEARGVRKGAGERGDAPRGNGRARSTPQRDELSDDIPF